MKMKDFLSVHSVCKKAKILELDSCKSMLSELVSKIESLPINEEITVNNPMGFILIGNEWWPVHVMSETGNGWVEWRVNIVNGCECGVSKLGYWAWSSADNTPCFPDEFMEMVGLTKAVTS